MDLPSLFVKVWLNFCFAFRVGLVGVSDLSFLCALLAGEADVFCFFGFRVMLGEESYSSKSSF